MNETKNKLSMKNEYWLPKERILELKHFCRQYDWWVAAKRRIAAWQTPPNDFLPLVKSGYSDPTASTATNLAFFDSLIEMVESSAKEANPELFGEIMSNVIFGKSYEQLNATSTMKVSEKAFYQTVRKFYYILSQKRR